MATNKNSTNKTEKGNKKQSGIQDLPSKSPRRKDDERVKGGGKASFNDISITKTIDTSTPSL